jgi:hypothetical protein
MGVFWSSLGGALVAALALLSVYLFSLGAKGGSWLPFVIGLAVTIIAYALLKAGRAKWGVAARSYSVHVRDPRLTAERIRLKRLFRWPEPLFGDPETSIVLVKRGFSWPAAIFGVLWALLKGLCLAVPILLLVNSWIPASVLKFLAALLAGAFGWPADTVYGVADILLWVARILVGAYGNRMVRWELKKDGFEEVGSVAARSRNEGLRRFLAEHPDYRSWAP